MIAAIYARKSTEQAQPVCRAAGRRRVDLHAAKGWPLGPIFKDEAVSGWTVPLDERSGGKAMLAAPLGTI
jgi:DNA invertase Pin-like site-specific DNA recombinase